LAVTEQPQSNRAWDIGANGEETLGARLSRAAGPRLGVVHDRRLPGTRANIDHTAVAPGGVFVIDAKKYKGRPVLNTTGGLLSPRVEKLMVNRRDCTKLVTAVLKQAEAVAALLREHGHEVPVHAILCFVDADWPLIGGAIKTQGVRAMWPRRLAKILAEPGPLGEPEIAKTFAALTTNLAAR
jgi:hypothetical protein